MMYFHNRVANDDNHHRSLREKLGCGARAYVSVKVISAQLVRLSPSSFLSELKYHWPQGRCRGCCEKSLISESSLYQPTSESQAARPKPHYLRLYRLSTLSSSTHRSTFRRLNLKSISSTLAGNCISLILGRI
ncbi:hypothetical protein M405DRAFT_237995 [Rhizopogon salebrosus TDB-379]|nr:hypothetical protein M405DRAFT_237995 [Rhizopogon salebrosus TDB-379]